MPRKCVFHTSIHRIAHDCHVSLGEKEKYWMWDPRHGKIKGNNTKFDTLRNSNEFVHKIDINLQSNKQMI